VTLLVEDTDTDTAESDEEAAPSDLARWHIRAVALIVDTLPGVAVVATMALVWRAVPPGSVWWWISVSILGGATLLTLVNRVALPATIGWTLGRALVGIVVVRPDGSAAGPGRLLCRELAHLLDTLSVFVGWLWPLWDSRKRTFADLLLSTEVHRVGPDDRPAGARRLTAIIVSTAVLLCVGGAAMSVFAVFLPDRAADQARAALAEQGPKIVTQILTYDPKLQHDEFAHALSMTTDKYRPLLLKQQEVVQKGHPVVNEYWVTDSSVLSATRNHATMLLFLQGHRGDGQQDRPITATVQVSFVKSSDARWLVDDLTVVTKPKPAKAQK
jgi:Mce-associated membrane protein